MAEIIMYEGVNYRKIECKAEVGDLVHYVVDDSNSGVSRVSAREFDVDDFYTEDGAYIWVACGDRYAVLEDVTEESEPHPDVHALIANLGRRLHEVESTLAPKEFGVIDLSATYPKYFKDVSDIASIDVYKTHELFGIDDPSGAIQHASKKLLLSGARTGGKSKFTDIKEARDTLSRWLEINAIESEASE